MCFCYVLQIAKFASNQVREKFFMWKLCLSHAFLDKNQVYDALKLRQGYKLPLLQSVWPLEYPKKLNISKKNKVMIKRRYVDITKSMLDLLSRLRKPCLTRYAACEMEHINPKHRT